MAVSMACAGETLIVRAKKGFLAVPTESRPVRSYAEVNEVVIAVPNGYTDDQYAAHLRASGRYEYVSLNPVVRPCRRPDDPKFPFQWHHTTMQSERAWDIRSGLSSDVVVGLVDTGVDLSHPDLASNLVSGWDMISNRSQASGGDVQDDEGHGTAMAGLIGAKGNNGLGVTGMGWGIKIMPIKVIDGATLDQLLAGARKAADLGCKVVNVSYEGVAQQAVETTGQYCKSKDALLVYSAGNNGANLNFDYPSVIVVGGSNQQDQLLAGSAYGQAIDLVAPGSTLMTTARYGKYDYTGGTSASAAITSGVAAMMRWINPYMTWQTWARNLVRGTVDLGVPGEDNSFGWGRLDTYRSTIRVVPFTTEPMLKPPGSSGLDVRKIGDNGIVVGRSFRQGLPGSDGFIYRDGVYTLLPPLPGDVGTEALTIDDSGIVYGVSVLEFSFNRPYRFRACSWAPPSYACTEILSPANPFPYGGFEPELVNLEKMVIGTQYRYSGPDQEERRVAAYSFGNGAGIMPPLQPTDYTYAFDLNDAGIAVGYSGNIAVRWSRLGPPIPIAPFNGEGAYAVGINNSGTIVCFRGGGLQDSFLVIGNNVVPLPKWYADARWSEASFINSTEQVLALEAADVGGSTAVIYNHRLPEDLNNLLVDSSVDLYQPLAMNRFGAMIAWGVSGAEAFILRPLYNQGQGGLTVNCSVILADYTGDPYKVPITLKLYQNGVLKETIPNLVPLSNGYKFTTLLKGVFTVMVSAPHFLTKKITNVTIEDGIVSGLDATLQNGDIDGDNIVSILDYIALSEAFEAVSDVDGNFETEDPSPNWNPNADLDGDDVVSVLDYITLSNNFDREGDTLQ